MVLSRTKLRVCNVTQQDSDPCRARYTHYPSSWCIQKRPSFACDSGDLVSINDPLSRPVTRFLDGAGRLIAVTNPLAQSTRNDYDALNEITTATDAAGSATTFSYDGNGNLLSVTDANSHATAYSFDSMDRLLVRTDPLGNSINSQEWSNGLRDILKRLRKDKVPPFRDQFNPSVISAD